MWITQCGEPRLNRNRFFSAISSSRSQVTGNQLLSTLGSTLEARLSVRYVNYLAIFSFLCARSPRRGFVIVDFVTQLGCTAYCARCHQRIAIPTVDSNITPHTEENSASILMQIYFNWRDREKERLLLIQRLSFYLASYRSRI